MSEKKQTIKEIHGLLSSGSMSVKDLVKPYLRVIEEQNDDINAYLEVFGDINDQVADAQEKIDKGEATLLTGIPLGMKDNILIKGRAVSAASKILENYTAPYSATITEKLLKERAVFLGRTNMDEFAMGSSTENSAYGVTKNPRDKTRVPGGSSGGSAAAVAMGGALAALGSDTGGSIRQPASFCGVVGLKPTYGALSRYGLIAMGSSFDQIGPIANSVSDVEVLFDTLKGSDPLDSTSLSSDVFKSSVKKKMVVGVPKQVLEADGLSKESRSVLDDACKEFKEKGYEVREIDMPNLSHSLSVYYILMAAESSTNLARFDGVKYGKRLEGKDLLEEYMKTRGELFGKEVRRRIMLGTYILSAGYYDAYYNKATLVRRIITKEFKDTFASGVDCILSPTTPTPAFRIGEKVTDPLQMYLADIFTVPANVAGVPALSIPFGSIVENGINLPLGIQLTAQHGHEADLFRIGKDILNES